MSIRIQSPLLNEHLSYSTLRLLGDHLPDNTRQDHALLKRYEAQIERGTRITREINEEAKRRGIKNEVHFTLTDTDKVCLARIHKQERPYISSLSASVQKRNSDPEDHSVDVFANLALMELLDDREVKAVLSHELGHADQQIRRFKNISGPADALARLEHSVLGRLSGILKEKTGGRVRLGPEKTRDQLNAKIKAIKAHYDNQTRKMELYCDDFSADFTGDRFAVISALEKIYRYDLAKLEADKARIRTKDDQDAWDAQRDNLEYQDAPHDHPSHSTRIWEQKSKIKLLPPGPDGSESSR